MTDPPTAEDRWRRFQTANRRRYAPWAVPTEALVRRLARGKTPGRALLLALSGTWQADLEVGLGRTGGATTCLVDYVRAGPAPDVQPKALFDQAWYLDHAPGLIGSRWAPLAHYLVLGDLEGRWPHPLVDPARVRRPGSGRTALQDFLVEGAAAGRDPHPLFDLRHYVGQCEDVAVSGENPLIHYLRKGWREGRSPHPDFTGAPDGGGVAPLLRQVTEAEAARSPLLAIEPGAGPTQADVTLVGYPFSPSGMGEHLRVTLRAMQAGGLKVRLIDLAGTRAVGDPAWTAMADLLVNDLGPLNVFCVNADEIDTVVARLGHNAFEAAANVIYPAWELSRYPEPYARSVGRFDEVWTPSTFVRDAVAAAVDRPVHTIPLAIAPETPPPLGRDRFGIPDDAFAVLFFLDFASHATRKNPEGVLAAVESLAARRPEARLCCVIKVRGTPSSRAARDAFEARVTALGARARVLSGDFTDAELKGLIRACDVFVSLHRSEGFGFGVAEAMALGRPAIATGYSGNLDFMPQGAALRVDHTLVPVPKGAYPHGEGQVWAEPSADHASRLIEGLMDDAAERQALAARGQAYVREGLSYAAVGARLAERVQALRRRQTTGSKDR